MEVRLCPTTYVIQIIQKKTLGQISKYVSQFCCRVNVFYYLFIYLLFDFKVNNLLKENNVNDESAIVQDNLVSGWTCNTENLRGKLLQGCQPSRF